MTNEEALEYLENDVLCLKDHGEYYNNSDEYDTVIDVNVTAISALEKQVPVPPTQDAKTKWHCMQCGNWIAERQHFCDKCGQAIDWRCLDVQGS